ncbi:uncharacterized protein SCHCODRAFT_02616233 [Schizophyllum commune H4-8]|uniref:uncharacterized protein n=1 Tax=Schizophyllum commune (strain H4-8 / FGSC 9210) TaxID=578458 RepID=UPI002160EA05|nr:uncharacterized protein SCHCODRAFT_02616233 [Schizophyllum commune H4-8]KAI5896930.1 hypothetical protein SCHCODRAFT_02616233 [Schizophyllum commune H4-8]
MEQWLPAACNFRDTLLKLRAAPVHLLSAARAYSCSHCHRGRKSQVKSPGSPPLFPRASVAEALGLRRRKFPDYLCRPERGLPFVPTVTSTGSYLSSQAYTTNMSVEPNAPCVRTSDRGQNQRQQHRCASICYRGMRGCVPRDGAAEQESHRHSPNTPRDLHTTALPAFHPHA